MAGQRSIFEEVGADAPVRAVPKGGVIDAAKRGARRGIRGWLIVLFALVSLMIVVGGLTRLTDSGLSITEWRPVTGALPPMSDAAWQEELEKYRQIPEYQLQNKGMSLDEFKVIYWWEWGHRQLGRVIGLVWALGFFYFLMRRQIPPGWTPRLVLIGALGGVQGAIGWWMVSSGLTGTMLDVASYRLATHLGLAFLILGFIGWYIMLLGRSEADLMQARRSGDPGLYALGTGLLYFSFVQILFGALVAGIDAGQAYNEWPLMGGQIIPPTAFDLQPVWRNFFENEGMVQFVHRMTAYALFIFGVYVWWRSRRSGNARTKFAFNAVMAVLFLQMLVGIMTVLYGAPWQIAIFHQLSAVVLFALIIWGRFLARYPRMQSVRS